MRIPQVNALYPPHRIGGGEVIVATLDDIAQPKCTRKDAVTVHSLPLRRRYPDARIEWLGFAEAEGFYRAIDVILVASIWAEPLPRTLIESLAHGLGAICARSGGIPEIAYLARKSISYPPLDTGTMTEALAAAADWREGEIRDARAARPVAEAG